MDGDDLRPYAQLVQDRIDELKAQIPEDLGDKGIYYLAWGLSASRAVDHIDLLEKSNEQLVNPSHLK